MKKGKTRVTHYSWTHECEDEKKKKKKRERRENLLYERISIHVHTTLRPLSGNQMSRPLINRFKRNDTHLNNLMLI